MSPPHPTKGTDLTDVIIISEEQDDDDGRDHVLVNTPQLADLHTGNSGKCEYRAACWLSLIQINMQSTLTGLDKY